MSLLLEEAPADSRSRAMRHGVRNPRGNGLVRTIRRHVLTESGLVVLAAGAVFTAAAVLLDFRYEVFPPDSVFRMANGFYVLFSRHFHLAAIGFVWNPLTSVADMVPLLFKNLWHPLTTRDVAPSIVTVVSMTAAVHQAHALMMESGVSRWPRLLLTALFTLNPMIIYYSANGMSEALYVFTTVAIARYLRRWLVRRDVRSLLYAATMLALCYLAREEGVAIAATTGLLVFAISAFRSSRGNALMAGLTDAAIYLMPFAAAFSGWALASLVITGSPFAQFTSQYGNSAQIQDYGSYFHLVRGHYAMRLAHEVRDLEALAPLLPLLLIIALFLMVRRHDSSLLVPLVVFGGGLGFTALSYLDNQIFPWFRFYVLAVPLEILLLSGILSTNAPRVDRRGGANARAARSRSRALGSRTAIGPLVALLASLLVIGPSLATTATAMNNPAIGIEESAQLSAVFHPSRFRPPVPDDKLLPILSYLERMNLSNGDILTDDAYDCMATAITRSSNPKIFVITNDSDFHKILSDPLTWHTHYLVVPPPGGVFNAINAAYPNIYETGAGFARMVHQFPSTSICPTLRLYQVVGHTNTP